MKIKRNLLGWAVLVGSLLTFLCAANAQQLQPVSSLQEDCGVSFNFSAASSGAQAAGTVTAGSTGTTPVIDNEQAACLYWEVSYSTDTTVTGISLLLQTAVAVAGVSGTWSSYPGTIDSGINPNTVVTAGGAVTEVHGPKYPFVRLNLTFYAGTGNVKGKLIGWKNRPVSVSIVSGGGCVGTAGTPCVVDGPTAAGSAPTKPPVMVAGQDGTNVQTLKTDTLGDLQTQAIGNGAVLSGQQAVTGSAVALATHTARAACVKALVGNSINVFVGPTGITTSTGYLLAPGESLCLPVTNTNLLFVIASTTGASVSWLASQ
jgi:hypothetical protein